MGREWLEHAPEPTNGDPNLLGFGGPIGFVCRDCASRIIGRGCNINALATEPLYKPQHNLCCALCNGDAGTTLPIINNIAWWDKSA